MTIKDYKLIQADGSKALAAEVMRFAKEGYVPVGAPFKSGLMLTVDGVTLEGDHFAQAIILREPESATLKRLMDLERHVDQIVTELDNPIAGETAMLTFAHEELEKALQCGPFERKR